MHLLQPGAAPAAPKPSAPPKAPPRTAPLRTAPAELLPRLVLIEDRPTSWSVNIYSLMQARGYALLARSRQNAIFQLRVTS